MISTEPVKRVHEPLFHIVRRRGIPWYAAWGIRILVILAGLLVCSAVIVATTGENPLSLYATMVQGAFGTSRRMWSMFQSTAILLCVSLAVTPAFKMRFWNIGAEGQVLMGGLASASCMVLLGDKLPNWLLLIVIIVTSIIAGAVWALIPAVFKAKWNTNETLFTLMMNYIAMQIVSFFTYIWSVPKGSGKMGVINQATQAGWLPRIGTGPGAPYILNVLVVLALTALLFVYLNYSKHGYELSVVGESENTAKYIGINVKKVIIRTMILSGALCGVAGLLLVSGTDHTLTRETAAGRGFTAIMVSWLAKFNPIYMILSAFLLVFLEKGASEISTVFGLNNSFSEILSGIIIFFIIGSEFFIQYRILFRESKKGGKAQ